MHGIGPKYASTYSNNDVKISEVNESGIPLMNIMPLLESYYKEIDLIKDMLNLKQESYGKVIFPKGQ